MSACACGGGDSAATSINSFKSASTARVDVETAGKLYYTSRTLGNCDMCPASAQIPVMDTLNRPYGGNAKRFVALNDASCACFLYTLSEKLKHETAERFMTRCSQDYVGNMK
jgi:hypothetical protein